MLHNVHQLDLNYFCLLFDARQVAYRAVLAKNSDQLWRKKCYFTPRAVRIQDDIEDILCKRFCRCAVRSIYVYE